MNVLYNRRLACAVLAVCVLLSVFGLGGAELARTRKNALRVFDEGIDTSFAVRMSVDAYLENSANYAREMAEEYRLRVGSAWDGQAKIADEAEKILSGEPGQRLNDYRALVADVESLYTDFHAAVTDEDASRDFDRAYKNFKSEHNKIQYDEYHSLARDYNSEASGFPAGAVAGLWNLSELDPFDP